MTTSSEDVLKVIEYVRVKKNDGTLYMMAERIAWMPNGKDSFTISHLYADIKTQKISPEGKPKIQLQIVLDNGSDTFHFVNPNGTQSQLNDRNEVKELLQNLLPKFKRKLSKEIEEKSRILSEDPELFRLYKELVTSEIITAEEFWANYAANKRLEPKDKNDTTSGQSIGVSAAFLADIQPQVDGCNGIKYNITKDIIEAIFNTYPAVKRKHFESVPHKVSEQDFWQRFFQSHYFHRDRSTNNKDFFIDCSKNDIERALRKGIIDPFVDLSSMDDRTVPFSDSTDETDKSRNDSINSLSNSNQALIKRFNHHSIMVLDSCLNRNKGSDISANPPPVLNGNINKKAKTSHTSVTTTLTPVIDDKELIATQQERERTKRLRLEEWTQMEDLSESNSHSVKIPVLNITKSDRYLSGPIPNGDNGCDIYNNSYSYDSNHNNNSDNNTLQSYQQIRQLVSNWRPRCQNALNSGSAISALKELSPGGDLMKTSHSTNLRDEVPLDVQKQLKNLTFALNELLRHFWSCFPATTPQIEEKLYQMKNTLERFQYVKIHPFHENLIREYHTTDLTAHLLNQIQVAFNRFNSWQAKKTALNRK